MNVLFSTNNIIHTRVRIVGECDWFQATWLYRTPYKEEKSRFWQYAMEMLEPTNMPWFCWGDLNEVMWGHEKAGAQDGSCIKSKFLQEFIEIMKLIDLGFSGPRFTWRATRNNRLIQ